MKQKLSLLTAVAVALASGNLIAGVVTHPNPESIPAPCLPGATDTEIESASTMPAVEPWTLEAKNMNRVYQETNIETTKETFAILLKSDFSFNCKNPELTTLFTR